MRRYRLLLVVLVLLLSGCGPQHINYGAALSPPPQLVVQAEGLVRATPDQLQLRLGVVTKAAAAGVALDSNNQRMTEVLQMLRAIGLDEAELATGQFQIRPEWSRPPRPTPANWQRRIVGYRVGNELLITTTKVNLAGQLLSLASRAGANQIGGLQFQLADPTAYRQQAIEQATTRAIRKAQAMAAAAGVKLGAVQSIRLNPTGGGPQPIALRVEARSAAADSVPVVAGKVEVAAAVTMIFRLEEARKTSK